MSFFSRAVSAVTSTASNVVNTAGDAIASGARNLDPTSSRSIAGRGLRTASRVPGLSSSLTLMTGGVAALNPSIRANASREIATGAAIGGAVGGASLLGGKGPATLASTEAARTPVNTPGGLDELDRAAGLEYSPGGNTPGGLDELDRAAAARGRVTLAGIGADPVLLIAGAVIVGAVLYGMTRR